VAEEQALNTGQRYFLVGETNPMDGLFSLSHIAHVPQNEWQRITAQEVMVPWERVARVEAQADLLAALKIMGDAKVGQVPVIDQEAVVGILTRDHVIHYIRVWSEWNI
jgi:predicted transcriptional regulator